MPRMYQVRIYDEVTDRPMSEPTENLAEAQAKLEEVRQEIITTWANPDPDAAYIYLITKPDKSKKKEEKRNGNQ